MPWHSVQQGDCISSIALTYGFLASSIWTHPDNETLKNKREDPSALKPRDRVFVPDKQPHKESIATDQKHDFLKKSARVKIKLQLKMGTLVLTNENVVLDLDGTTHSLCSDGDGFIELPVSPTITQGSIAIANGKRMTLNFGHLDPADETSGVQARLNNLGIDVGAEDGLLGKKTAKGLKRFQKAVDLEETGQLNSATTNKLKEMHGS